MNQIAPRTAYPVDLAVSRETCSALRWYSVSTVRTPLYRLLRHPHAPMRRQMHSQSKWTSRVVCCTAPCPTLALEACRQVLDILLSIASEHERDPHVVLIARRASGTSPGGGLEIPFPYARIDPAYIGVPSTGRISTRTVLRRLAAVSRETGSQPPGSAPYLPLQSGGAHRDFRILCPSQCTAIWSAPAKADVSSTLFHLSTTPSIPSDATVLDGRPSVST